jgi:PhnB protein
MKIDPYLFFNGRCEEAIEFYKSALGAEVTMLLRFKENPDKPPPGAVPPGSDDKIMHAGLRIGDSQIMASDGMNSGQPVFQGVSLTLSVPNEAEADRLYNALGAGGQVQMPIGKTFFSPRFGMVADRFGVSWMIIVPQLDER